MPFVPNADALARSLAPDSGKTIRLGTTPWLPNERIVGMFPAAKDSDAVRDWSMRFETITTSPKTIQLRGERRVDHTNPLNLTFGKVRTSLYKQTASMAKVFSERGTSIAVARDIPQAWEMARLIASQMLGKGIAVHHAGLSDESRALIEWLAESAKLRVLCATTTIAQGINFPVSSVFLATRKLPVQGSKDIPSRAFWNLAGRAGRIDHDSVGVVGIAAGDDPAAVQSYVGQQTVELISRLVSLLDTVEAAGHLSHLSVIIHTEQWADFRSYVKSAEWVHVRRPLRALRAAMSVPAQNLRGKTAKRGRS